MAAALLLAIVALGLGCAGSAFAATPVLSITHPETGSSTGEQQPLFQGASDDPSDSVVLQIHSGASSSGTLVQTATVPTPLELGPEAAAWEVSPESALAPGEYTAVAEQTNVFSEKGESSPVTFTIDTAPVVSIKTVSSPTNDPRPTLSGSVSNGPGDETAVAVTVYAGASVGGTVAASEVVSRTGSSWEYTPSVPLPEGEYTVRVTQEDTAREVGESAPMTFAVDTTAPNISMSSVSSPTGSEPTLTGGAGIAAGDEAGVAVFIYAGAIAGGTDVVEAQVPTYGAATWSYKATSPLAEGTYTARVFQRDDAGNVGESAEVTFNVLTKPPVVSIASPINGAILHVTQPTFEGTAGNGAEDQETIQVKIYPGPSASGIAIEETVEREGAQWKLPWAHELANGTYTALAIEEDKAGNRGESYPVTFKIKSILTLETSAFEKVGRTGLVAGPTPSFQGDASEASPTVTVSIYGGPAASGRPTRVIDVTPNGTRWASGPVEALEAGVYTVQAEQHGAIEEFQFTVDAKAPQLTLTSPSNGSSTTSSSQAVGGAAGSEEGDIARVTIHLYAGSSASGGPLQTTDAEAIGQTWAAAFGGLEPGTYTAMAQQEDDVGNVGHSEAVTFTVVAPPVAVSPAAPAASFTWFPATPHTGESVSLVSTSTDASSAITSFGWALSGNGTFTVSGSTVGTSFSTPGPHVVQLHVVDANGQSSTVAETIPVSAPVIPLMQPFPVVHVAGSYSSSGAKIGVLTVLAPVGATVRVTCKGGGCPHKGQRVRAVAGARSKASSVLITFHRFDRSLRTGAVLDVWISDAGEIGKFTRLVIRRDKPPSRTDLCLNPAGTAPLTCPAS